MSNKDLSGIARRRNHLTYAEKCKIEREILKKVRNSVRFDHEVTIPEIIRRMESKVKFHDDIDPSRLAMLLAQYLPGQCGFIKTRKLAGPRNNHVVYRNSNKPKKPPSKRLPPKTPLRIAPDSALGQLYAALLTQAAEPELDEMDLEDL